VNDARALESAQRSANRRHSRAAPPMTPWLAASAADAGDRPASTSLLAWSVHLSP